MSLVSYLKSNYKNLKNHIKSSKNDHTDVKNVSFNLDNLGSAPIKNFQDKKSQGNIEENKIKSISLGTEIEKKFIEPATTLISQDQKDAKLISQIESNAYNISIIYEDLAKLFNQLDAAEQCEAQKESDKNNKAGNYTMQLLMILDEYIEDLIVEKNIIDRIVKDLRVSLEDKKTGSPQAYKVTAKLMYDQAIKAQTVTKIIEELKILSHDKKNSYEDDDQPFYELSNCDFLNLQDAAMLLGNDSA
jgi:hypothetical protein